MLAAYIHRLDPFAIEFAPGVGIRWYGLAYVAGFIVGALLVKWLARRMKTPLRPEQVWDFALAIAVGTIVGGRLGYCLFYRPDLFISFETSFPWWGVLAINQGGMSSHGGIIGIIVAGVYFARSRRIPPLHLLDMASVGAPLGIFFGRIANFINAELLGRRADESLPWAVKFPQEILDWHAAGHPLHDELLSPRFLAAEQLAVELRPNLADASPSAVHQAMIELSRTSQLMAEALAPVLPARHPSQLYAAVLEGLVVFAVVMLAWRKPRKPGVVAGCFAVTYAVVRIIGEQFRLPDAHIGFELFGLTRGQWLSIILLLVCVGLLVFWARRPVDRIGGWGVKRVEAANATGGSGDGGGASGDAHGGGERG